MSERVEFEEFLEDMESEDYKDDTIDAFRVAGEAMLESNIDGVADILRSIQSAMRGEYGD